VESELFFRPKEKSKNGIEQGRRDPNLAIHAQTCTRICQELKESFIIHGMYQGEYTNAIHIWYELEDALIIGIWIVVIYRMTPTFNFYLMTLLHLIWRTSLSDVRRRV
jgi:hypothetical protein